MSADQRRIRELEAHVRDLQKMLDHVTRERDNLDQALTDEVRDRYRRLRQRLEERLGVGT